jgi:DNA-3-methyladenine glycosylase II
MSQRERRAVARLRAADPVLARMIGELGGEVPRWTPSPDPYGALVRAMVGQQLSVASAAAIFGRLQDRFGGRVPTPAEVLADDPDRLKAVGLSHAKVVSLISLAQHLQDGALELDRLGALGDDALVAQLTAVKGIGEWTAQVFMVIGLAREDVLVAGDLVIRQAVQRGWALDHLPARDELYALAEPWRPHRSTACAVLWAWARLGGRSGAPVEVATPQPAQDAGSAGGGSLGLRAPQAAHRS